MKSPPPLRAAIIGCGRIAGGYDETSPSEFMLTHAKAYLNHPATDLVAVADIDGERARRFADRWHAPQWYADPCAMLRELRPDVVSVCTPDETHADFLEAMLEDPPVAVWCEKPVATDVARAERLVAEYERRGIVLAVNYHRRWDSALSVVERAVKADGVPSKAIVTYGKGLMHSGSHALDLLLSWFGPVKEIHALSLLCDYKIDDPTMSAWIRFENGSEAFLVGHDDRQYTLWEIDIVGKSWRYRITQAGACLEAYKTRHDPVFGGYEELDPVPDVTGTDIHVAIYRALDNIVSAVRHQDPVRSTGRTAIETLKLCTYISEQRHA